MNKTITVLCECGEELEIMWSEDFYGIEQVTVKPHDCILAPEKLDEEYDDVFDG